MAEEGIKKLREECINTGLCVECGACAAVCPTQAITLKEYEWGRNPELTGECPDEPCDVCYRVCPAVEVPSYKIEETFFGRRRKDTFPEKAIGVVRGCYSGYSLIPEIRETAYAGGVLCAVLSYALEARIIDAAVVAGYDPERPWRAVTKIASTKQEIIESTGSKYQPHPHLLGLKEAADKGFKKIAITATPCYVDAIRKMQLCDDLHDMTDNIELVFGLVCAAHWPLHGTEHLIKSYAQIPLHKVAKLNYRARPFPGLFQVISKDGEVYERDFVQQLLPQLMRFTSEHCRLCPEKAAMFPDITFGDVWKHPVYSPEKLPWPVVTGKTFRTDKRYLERAREASRGMSSIVTKSEKGEKVFKEAVDAGYVKMFPEPIEDCFTANQTIDRWTSTLPLLKAREHRGMPYRKYGVPFSI